MQTTQKTTKWQHILRIALPILVSGQNENIEWDALIKSLVLDLEKTSGSN